MSIQSARDFLTKVTEDDEFRKGLEGCKSGAEKGQFARRRGSSSPATKLERLLASFRTRTLR